MLAVKDRFDDVPRQRLGHDEQRGRNQHHCPAGIDRGGQRNGKEGSDDRANERNEAHEPGEDAPQDGIGNADEPQTRPNEDAKPSIEDGLHQEKAAQSCSRVVECCCAALQVGRSCQPKEPIADILALQQDEHQEEYGECGGRQRRQQGAHDVGDGFKALRLGLTHFYNEWLFTLRWRC